MEKDRYKIIDLVNSKFNKSIVFYYTNDDKAVKALRLRIEDFVNSNQNSNLAKCIVSHEALWNGKKFKIWHMHADTVCIDFEADLMFYDDSVIEEFLLNEPDLQVINDTIISKVHYEKIYDLSVQNIKDLLKNKHNIEFFEEACKELSKNEIKILYGIFTNEVMALLRTVDRCIGEIGMKPKELADLVNLISSNKINMQTAKDILGEIFMSGGNPSAIVKVRNLNVIDSNEAIESFVNKAIMENPRSVSDIKNGKKAAIGFLVGKVMKMSNGKANPKMVNEAIVKKLSEVK